MLVLVVVGAVLQVGATVILALTTPSPIRIGNLALEGTPTGGWPDRAEDVPEKLRPQYRALVRSWRWTRAGFAILGVGILVQFGGAILT